MYIEQSHKKGPFVEWLGDHSQLNGWGPIGTTHKFIFVHIPKTAGISIAAALDLACTQCHYPAREIKQILNKAEFGKIIWQNYFKFSFVRNPWSWIISNLFFHANIFNIPIDPSTFLTDWMTNGQINITNELTLRISRIMERGQYSFLSEEDTLLVDFVGKFENLQQDFEYICNEIGVPQTILLHKNKTREYKHYTEYYNEDAKQFIATKFAKEIKSFGYTFEK